MKTAHFAIAALCLLAVAHTAQAWSWNFGPFRRMMAEDDEVTVLPDYQQCGGIGGACNSTGSACVDKMWKNVKCGKSSTCARLSAHYHMCEPKTKATGKETESKPVKSKDGRTTLQPWNQCGGKTGDCKEYGPDGCMDCPFPKTSCADGYVCYRVVEFFWQCGPEEQYKSEAYTCEGEGFAPAPAPGPSGAALMRAERMCEAPMEGQAVQGKRFKAIQLVKGKENYDDCCESCSKDNNCVAFHLNEVAKTEVVCALFSEFGDIVDHSKATAGLMAGTGAAATIAG